MPISTLKTGGLDLKKIKRILAILGAIILAGLYISTIVCALSSNENYMDMLMASVYATVIIPVLIVMRISSSTVRLSSVVASSPKR